ncbi:MAG: NINE protein [Bacteroidetes bacterium]|nr:NINE protein [Bacteroidota bacterium]
MTGERLGLKGAIALRAAQRQVKKAIRQPVIETDKDQLVALILCIMVGWMGIHRMYLGYYGIGIIQLLTLGCCGLWTLLDMIRIITGNLQPKEGLYGETL